MEKRPVERHIRILDPEVQSLWKTTKTAMKVPSPTTSDHTRRIAFSHADIAEVLADNLEAHFLPGNDPTVRQLFRRLTWR